ncbi:MAG: hypothetical protein KDD15_26470 [Lewinella sp.]|nr:hypothetical protein [Lewinella sp.]
MTVKSENIHKIIALYDQLSYEEQIVLIKQLLSDLKRSESTSTNNILNIAGKGKGIYGNVEEYLSNERNWD